MRLFIGTFLNPSNQRTYEGVIKDLVGRHPHALRAIPEHSAHLTHAFCGDVDNLTADAIAGAVGHVAGEHRPFEIGVGAAQVVSAGSRPRLIVADIVHGKADLSRLSAALVARLEIECPGLEISPSRTPHVTLARFRKSARRSDAHEVSHTLSSPTGGVRHLRDEIADVQIVVSTLTPTGPVYSVRDQRPLTPFGA